MARAPVQPNEQKHAAEREMGEFQFAMYAKAIQGDPAAVALICEMHAVDAQGWPLPSEIRRQ
jgi:hypothetical protein